MHLLFARFVDQGGRTPHSFRSGRVEDVVEMTSSQHFPVNYVRRRHHSERHRASIVPTFRHDLILLT
jgi:hypothetical protein